MHALLWLSIPGGNNGFKLYVTLILLQYLLKIPEVAAMEAYNVGVFAVGQNSYLLLNDVEVLAYNSNIECIISATQCSLY